MVAAGDLRDRVTFQRRSSEIDDYGNEEGAWVDEFSCAAELVAARGTERVEAGALTGIQSWTIRVRDWTETEEVSAGWRAVNARKPTQIFNIRANVELTKYPGFREMAADEGVAT